jgi:hypothetical protein
VSVNESNELDFMPLYDDETLALMAKLDATFKVKARPTLAQVVVDQARLSAIKDGANGAEAGKESTGGNASAAKQVSLPLLQPFQVVLQTADLASLHKVKGTLAALLLKTPACELVSETCSYNEPFLAKFSVNSTLDTMMALKTKNQFLQIVIVGGAF